MLWKARNERLWNQESKGPWLIKLEAEAWIEAFWEANRRQRMPQQQQLHHSTYKWVKPPPNFYKVNVDAAYNKQERQAGMGVIIRDSAGQVLACFAMKIEAVQNPSLAEALALKWAITVTHETGSLQ